MSDLETVAAGYDRRPGQTALTERRYSRFLSLPARFLSGLIWVYQRTLSPALVVLNPTCGCRFAPTCSHYAREALQEHGFFAGIALTFVRLAKCGPWHPGGEDPVPPSPRLRRTGPPVCTAVQRQA